MKPYPASAYVPAETVESFNGIIYYDRTPSIRERFSRRRFSTRVQAWEMIADFFGVPLGSTIRYRDDDSLHNKKAGALAADFGAGQGSAANLKEQAICKWANTHRRLWNEVMWHDAGSGFHAHLAMRGKLRFMRRKIRRALRANGARFR